MSGETKPFNERLLDGQSFEDFCNDVLWVNGISLGLYRSRAKQWRIGETRIGAEIKYDAKSAETGNLFIETEERRDTDGQSQWRPAGIYDETGSWLYVIGNFHVIHIFSTRFLQTLHKAGKTRPVETPTAKGFLLTKEDIEKYHIRRIISPELTTVFKESFNTTHELEKAKV